MRKSRFPEQEIAHAVKQAELGVPVLAICRKLGISRNTFYRWRRCFGAMTPSAVRRLKQLEEENRRQKAMVAVPSLDKQMLQDVLRKETEAGPAASGRPAPLPPSLDLHAGGAPEKVAALVQCPQAASGPRSADSDDVHRGRRPRSSHERTASVLHVRSSMETRGSPSRVFTTRPDPARLAAQAGREIYLHAQVA